MTRHRDWAPRGLWRSSSWYTAILVLALLVQGGVAIWLGSRGWFSGDLIHYYAERGGAPGGGEGLMEPHSSHWQFLLITVYLLMFKLFGLTTYVPYLALTVVVHLALVVVMHQLLVRLGVHRLAALVSAIALLTYGQGSEAFLVEAPVALTSSMLLGAIAVTHALRRDFSSRACLVASCLLLASVMISLGGVVAAVWVGFFALSRGISTMIRVVALPAAAFLTWFLVLGRSDSRILLSSQEVLQVPEAAWALLVSPFDNLSAGWGAGPALVLAVAAATVWGARGRPLLVSAVLAGFMAAVFHAVVSAVAQLPYGFEQVTTSRYRYVVLVALLPGLALLLDAVVSGVRHALAPPQRRVASALGVALSCLFLVHAALGQYRVGQSVVDIGDKTQSLLAGTIAAESTGEKAINDAVRGSYISGDDLTHLADPSLRGELAEITPSEEDRIAAESNYFVDVSSDEIELGSPAEVSSDSFDRELVPGSGCRVYNATNATPTVTFTSFIGAGFRVRSDATEVTTRLSRPEKEIEGDPIQWRVEPGEWAYVATSAQVAQLDVTFDIGGTFTFCLQ